jgi:drug/metabolite transporter (DMT)-like permease
MTETPHRPLIGILLVLLSVVIQPVMDAATKTLVADYPVLEVVWGRYFFHMVMLVPLVMMREGARALLPANLGMQLLRSFLLLGASVTFIFSLRTTPMAEALALAFVGPLVTVASAALLLKEPVGPHRWSAVAIGFLGVLLILRPSGEALTWGTASALASGVFYGLFLTSTRRVAGGGASPLVTLAFTGVVGGIALTLVLPFVWVAPTPTDWGLMAFSGVAAAAGHFLLIVAYGYAPAPVLAPFGYAKIINMTFMGYLIFGDFPDAWSWAGIAVLIASGVYISIREAKTKKG